jgi:uncharacterized protein (DUF1499 family)
MAESSIAAGDRRGPTYYLPRLGFGLGTLALLLLVAGPVGWRTGLLHFRTALFYLMPYGAYAAIAGGVVSLMALFWWRRLERAARAMALAGVALGLVVIAVPWYYNSIRSTLPPIHDITTDMADPPTFLAVMPARAAENGNSVAYAPEIARQQKIGYPDIAPLKTALPPAEAFKRALETAQSMPRWTIVASDPAAGRIEASQSSRFYGFTDDVSIRVLPDGTGSRIDMRSLSRQGRHDYGVNAARVRAYLAALKQRME